jgi:hypothetical protein
VVLPFISDILPLFRESPNLLPQHIAESMQHPQRQNRRFC